MLSSARTPSSSAHGKAILIGEHAVVHGVAAIAVPVGLTIHVDLGNELASGLPTAFGDWFGALALERCGRVWLPQVIRSDLPTGAGLGSSAALSVAALRALAQEAPSVVADVMPLADAAERLFHGNPSGIDVRAVLADTPIWCRREPAGVATAALPLAGNWQFSLWVTPVQFDTKTMVARVSAALDADNRGQALRCAAAEVDAAKQALAHGDAVALGAAMNAFHGWLSRYGASTPTLDALVVQALAAGALGAKLTGAGGGGAVLVLWPDAQPHAAPDGVTTAARFVLQAPQ